MPVVLVVGIAVVAFALYSNNTARRVDVALPLCAACDERWSKAKAVRPFFLGAVIVSVVVLLAGVGTEGKKLVVGGGALFVAICVYAIVTRPAARFVTATSAEGSRVTLAQVSERAVELIRAGGPLRKKKKKRKAPANESQTDD